MSKDNEGPLLIFFTSTGAERHGMIDYIIFQKEELCRVLQLQKGVEGSLQPRAVEEVLHCPSNLVLEKQTLVRTRRAEVDLLAEFTKGLFSAVEGALSSVSRCCWSCCWCGLF